MAEPATRKEIDTSKVVPRYPGTPAPAAVEATRVPEPKAEELSSRTPKKPRLVPPSELGRPPIVGESAEDLLPSLDRPVGKKKVPEPEKKKKGPSPLIPTIPPAATSVDWSEGEKSFSLATREELRKLLRITQTESSRWQNDLSTRFITCSEGKCLVRDRGDGNIEVPYQVGIGRVWLLRIEAQYLEYALENNLLSSQEQFQEVLQLVRRVDSLEAHLKHSHEGSKTDYLTKLEENIENWRAATESWNVYEDTEEKNWVLRWQLLAKDVVVLGHRLQKLKDLLNHGQFGFGAQVTAGLKSFLKKVGTKPWKLSDEEQYELARELYFESTAPLRDQYREVSRFSDKLLTEPDNYVEMQVMMGAAENIAVYSWRIMDDLAAKNLAEK